MTEEKANVQELPPEKRRELADRVKARAIVQEILDFGVSDSQICEVIKMLALELESRETMLKILEILGSPEDEQHEHKIYT